MLFVRSKRVVYNTATTNQDNVVLSVPACTALDVYVRWKDDAGNLESPYSGAEQWKVFAVTGQSRNQVGTTKTTSQQTTGNIDGTVGRSMFAIRDCPAEGFDLVLNGGAVAAGNTLFFDVAIIGWGTEPTGIGPLQLNAFTNGENPPTDPDAFTGLAVFGRDQTNGADIWRTLSFNVVGIQDPAVSGSLDGLTNANVLPVGQYRAVAPTLTNLQLLPLQLDANGNLKVIVESGSAGTFPAASALADNDPNPTTTRIGANNLFYDGATWDLGRSGFITAQTGVGWQNVLSGGVYNSSAPTLTNGQAITIQLDVSGNLKTRDQALPAAAALADATANPTTSLLGAPLMVFNGTTWDRARSGGIAAATPTGWQNGLAGGVYNSSAPTLTNGQAITLQLDVNGNLKGREQYQPAYEDNSSGVAATAYKPVANAAYAWLSIFNTALAAKLVIKASAGTIRRIEARIDSTLATGTYYVQFWNLTDVPADATAVSTSNSFFQPFKVQHVNGTDDYISIDFGEGVFGSTGLTIGLSTTEFTKTASGANMSATGFYV